MMDSTTLLNPLDPKFVYTTTSITIRFAELYV
jgi:hypothetical protein